MANNDKIKGSDHDKFVNFGEQALLCKKMATILRDAPLDITLEDTLKKPEDEELLHQFYQELEFHSFLKPVTKVAKSYNYKILNKEDLATYLLPNTAIICENEDYNYHKYPILALGLANNLGNFIIEQRLFHEPEFIEFMEKRQR